MPLSIKVLQPPVFPRPLSQQTVHTHTHNTTNNHKAINKGSGEARGSRCASGSRWVGGWRQQQPKRSGVGAAQWCVFVYVSLHAAAEVLHWQSRCIHRRETRPTPPSLLPAALVAVFLFFSLSLCPGRKEMGPSNYIDDFLPSKRPKGS